MRIFGHPFRCAPLNLPAQPLDFIIKGWAAAQRNDIVLDFEHCAPVDRPCAWLDIDALEHNIAVVEQGLQGKQLRIGSKSVRCVEVMRKIAAASPSYVGILSYSAEESLFLLKEGFKDIVCAYPSLNLTAIEACERQAVGSARVVWMVDCAEQLAPLTSVAKKLGRPLRVCIELNLSTPVPGLYFGTRRSQLDSLQALERFLTRPGLWDHARVVGVMGYEAQIAGVATGIARWSPQVWGLSLLKSFSCRKLARFRKAAVEFITHTCGPLEFVNGGGSGSLSWTASQAEVTEVAVGSAFYYPAYFSRMPSLIGLRPAAGFALPVTRAPEAGVVTCQSGGFCASGPIGADRQPQLYYPPGLKIFSTEGFGEVQTPLAVPRGVSLGVGDTVWLRHTKGGELCEHFNELRVYRGSEQVDRFLSYRGQGKSFH